MRTQFSKIVLAATFGLAMVFIFSCSSDGGDRSSPNINSSTEISSSSADEIVGAGSSSSITGGGSSSSLTGGLSSNGVLSSSSNNSNGSGSSSSEGGSLIDGHCSVSGFDGDEFIDSRDCKRYKYEVASNGQVWMSENLNYSRNNMLGWCYKTGAMGSILGATGEDWEGCSSPYGRHYTYDVAMDGTTGQGLCPDGWVIPSVVGWDAVSGMSNDFYVKAGNYDPSSGKWKERGDYGFYWARNIPSGNSVGFAIVAGTNIQTRLPGASNAAKTNDYFSVRCIMLTDFTPTCGAQTFNPATHKCIDGIAMKICTASDNTSTHYCSNGTLKQYGSMTDGVHTYKTVVIGTQTWMAENLDYEAEDSKCYDNDSDNCAKYGRLYNWATAMNIDAKYNSVIWDGLNKHKGICPTGWHLPNNADWNILIKFVNPSCSDNSNCANAGARLSATNGWNTGSGYKASTDDFGFSALPGGNVNSNGYFNNVSNYGYWWSSTEYNASSAYYRNIYYGSGGRIDYGYSTKNTLYSVRCVRD